MRIAINPPSSLAHFQFITPLPQCSRAGAGFSWRDPMKGAAGEDEPGHHSPAFHTLFSWLPPRPRRRPCAPPRPRAGAVLVISPERRVRGSGYLACLSPAPSHTSYRGGSRLGVGTAEENPAGPFPVPPRRGARALMARFHEGCSRKRGASRGFSRMQKPTVFYGVRAIICITDME